MRQLKLKLKLNLYLLLYKVGLKCKEKLKRIRHTIFQIKQLAPLSFKNSRRQISSLYSTSFHYFLWIKVLFTHIRIGTYGQTTYYSDLNSVFDANIQGLPDAHKLPSLCVGNFWQHIEQVTHHSVAKQTKTTSFCMGNFREHIEQVAHNIEQQNKKGTKTTEFSVWATSAQY